jgi:adhesin transport system outer membrane protein
MSKNRFLKILLPSIALTFGSQANAYTLQEAVGHTLASSPDFFTQVNNRDKVDKQLRGWYADYLPTVDLAAGWGEQYTNNPTTRSTNPLIFSSVIAQSPPQGTKNLTRTEFSLIASQMLFDGFAVYHNVEGHKARVRAESWRVNSVGQNVAQLAVEAYLKVLVTRELVGIHRENLATHERIFGQIHKRSEGGIGRKADLDQAEGRVALARTNLMAREADMRDAETDFLRTVGIPVPANLVHPEHPSPFPSTLEAAEELALKRHPELHAAFEDTNVTRAAHKGARAPFVPRVDFQLGMTRNHNIDGSTGVSDDNTAMLRMRWNLFRGGKDLAKLCETASQMQEAQETQNKSARQAIDKVRKDWVLYTAAKRQARYFKDHVDASERTSDAYGKQFNIGQRTLLDLLDSQNELNEARENYATGKYNEILGMFRVLNSTGCLTDYFNVPLPRQAEPRPSGLMDGSFRFFEHSSNIFD